MIIECKCEKRFQIPNDEIIPDGKLLKCSFCGEEWLHNGLVANTDLPLPDKNLKKISKRTTKPSKKPIGFIALLSSGLDFNATDNQPVDIIFLLITPSNNGSQHLQALASVSRLLRNSKLISKLRGCNNSQSAFAVITQSLKDEAA